MTKTNEDTPAPKSMIIKLNEQGIFMPRDSAEDARIAQMMLDTRVIPVCFETPQQVILAVQMLRGLEIPPALGMRSMMVVNNGLAIWGDLPKAACERYIETYEEFRFDKDYVPISFKNKNLHMQPLGSYTLIKRRDVINPIEGYFTMGQAQKAGLLNKKGPWSNYTDMMLMYRARSRALKTGFPDRLNGVPIAEYDYNIRDGQGKPFYGDASAAATGLADEFNDLADGEVIDGGV